MAQAPGADVKEQIDSMMTMQQALGATTLHAC
jgi:hypothetical protein